MTALIVAVVAALFSAMSAWISAQNNFILRGFEDRINRLEDYLMNGDKTHARK